MHGFWNPNALFWDENYHIASAQKYLNGTFFMEPHPPLGKLMIAFGEKIVDANEGANDQFIDTDYAKNPPAGFSFVGYRLFPVLFGWLTAPLLFGIFYFITKRNILWSTLFSFLYVFDNALIVHARSAMLDSTMLFFAALTCLAFLLLLEWKDHARPFLLASVLFGVGFGGIMATKAFGLIFILLIPFLAWGLKPHWKQIGKFLLAGGIAFFVIYCGAWYIHFSLATNINPSLPDNGYYQASAKYKHILDEGRSSSLLAFPVMLNDSWKFVSHYERGVPRLDLCKTDENGSPWYLWPVGARTINYRWETPNGSVYRYLTLQSNPIVWFIVLGAVLLTFTILVASVLLPMKEMPRERFLLLTFFTLYVCYMIAVSQITRVMYMYHYFLPLFFGFILVGLVFMELNNFGRWKLSDQLKTSALLAVAGCIFISFEFFRPLTYYEPIGDKAFKERALLRVWELKCVRCDKDNPVAVPCN